jgi:hypothetical protein
VFHHFNRFYLGAIKMSQEMSQEMSQPTPHTPDSELHCPKCGKELATYLLCNIVLCHACGSAFDDIYTLHKAIHQVPNPITGKMMSGYVVKATIYRQEVDMQYAHDTLATIYPPEEWDITEPDKMSAIIESTGILTLEYHVELMFDEQHNMHQSPPTDDGDKS